MPGVFQILSHTIVKGLFVETLIGATTLPSHATRDSWALYNPRLRILAKICQNLGLFVSRPRAGAPRFKDTSEPLQRMWWGLGQHCSARRRRGVGQE